MDITIVIQHKSVSCSILTEYFIFLEKSGRSDNKNWTNFSESVMDSNAEMNVKIPLVLKVLHQSNNIERNVFKKVVAYLRSAFDGEKINPEFIDTDFTTSTTGTFDRTGTGIRN